MLAQQRSPWEIENVDLAQGAYLSAWETRTVLCETGTNRRQHNSNQVHRVIWVMDALEIHQWRVEWSTWVDCVSDKALGMSRFGVHRNK